MIVKRYWLSIEISFSKVIPWLFFQVNLIGDWSDNLLLPFIDQIVSEFGTSIFLSDVIKPLSTKYPSSIFLGLNSVTFLLLSKSILYFLKVRSSIEAPFSEIDPITLWFSNWILLFWFKASSLEIFTIFSFWSKLGVSVFCSIYRGSSPSLWLIG